MVTRREPKNDLRPVLSGSLGRPRETCNGRRALLAPGCYGILVAIANTGYAIFLGVCSGERQAYISQAYITQLADPETQWPVLKWRVAYFGQYPIHGRLGRD